jgi:hypothetical protein
MQSLLGSFLSNHKPRSVLSEQSRELDSPAVMTATDEVGREDGPVPGLAWPFDVLGASNDHCEGNPSILPPPGEPACCRAPRPPPKSTRMEPRRPPARNGQG